MISTPLNLQDNTNYFFWNLGNKALREKDYQKALENYQLAKKYMPEFTYLIEANITYAESKIRVNKGYRGKNLLYLNKEIINKELINFNTYGLNKEEREEKIIVSLTSFPQRINKIHYTIYSLLTQSDKPDMLILWLAEKQFPLKEEELPQSLLDLVPYGLTIRFVEDIRSYKKLIPALQAFPNDVIVTADDDLFYEHSWLEKLMTAHKKDKQSIYCHRVHKILIENEQLLPYNKWKKSTWKELIENTPPSYRNFLTGGSGALYPPNCLDKEVYNEEIFMNLSPYADDVWFWAMALKKGTKIGVVDSPLQLVYVNPEKELHLNNEETLSKINIGEQKNDEQIMNVLSHYNLLPILLQKTDDEN